MLSEKTGGLISRILDLPKDVICDIPKIVIQGDTDLYIGGVKGVRKYTEDEINLSAAGKNIGIKGEKLIIKAIENEEITISGRICALEFVTD